MRSLIFFFLLSGLARAELVINEIMASNLRTSLGVMEFDDYPDWIEIYNSGDEAVSLTGCFLSDDSAEPRKWTFENGGGIEPGGFLLVVADGNVSEIGSEYNRGYPAGGKFTVSLLHTNFKLSAEGEELILSRDPDGGGNLVTLDRKSFSNQVADISFGRSAGDERKWTYFATPTPGAPNAGPELDQLRETSATVSISSPSGFYDEPVDVSMSAPRGEIYYTMDGSNPTPDSLRYNGSFPVVQNTVVRARVYEQGKVPGIIVTHSYFIDEEVNGLPILSMSAPDESLFSEEIGIYGNRDLKGGAVRKGIDAPGHLEFFLPDGKLGFAVNGGFRLGGENNFLSHAQKAFNFYARGKYGVGEINYDLFPGSGITKFTSLTLREGGDDWGQSHLTDAIFDRIARDRMEVETNRFRPAVLYINGEYWGLYNIRDRWDENWFFQEYGTNDGEFDHIIDSPLRADNGTGSDWDDLHRFLKTSNLADPEIWDEVDKRINLNSLVDFTIAETFGRNTSWSGNREWWLDHRPGSKWKWFLPDMDRTFGNSGDRPNLTRFLSRERTLAEVSRSPAFRNRLGQRAAAHLASTLDQERLHPIIDEVHDLVLPEISRQHTRWGAPTETKYSESIQRIKSLIADRNEGYLEELASALPLGSPVQLTLATNGAGRFRFAGVNLPPKTLQAYRDIPTVLEAFPAPGYRFDGWTGAEGGAKTTVTLEGDTTITANFVPDSSTELSGELAGSQTLKVGNSPYIVTSDLVVPSGTTLTIDPGVTLQFDPRVNLRVMGTLKINGREAEKVTFRNNRDKPWGGVSFEQPATQSTLAHLVLRGASRGIDSIKYPSAISGLNARVIMDHIDIGESRGPMFFRGGSIILRDSILDIPLTGDGLNVKQGSAETIRCTFTGNQSPDTDGIDYDGVIGGLIKDCRFYNFEGFNSDAIDTGEQCIDCLIEGNTIFYMTDKGISVGQGSSIIARKNLIVGCELGVAVKDEGSFALVDQNTFVSCTEGVAVYEKNFGAGGGLAVVTNCIFSQCEFPTTSDAYSTLTASHCLSDTRAVPGNVGNLQADPGFVDRASRNFALTPNSPAIDAGDPAHPRDPDGSRVDIGADYTYSASHYPFDSFSGVVINEILSNSGDEPDWIELHNRTNEPIDIGGWFLSDSQSNLKKYRIPENTIIPANGYFVFNEMQHFGEASNDPGRLESFALSDTGETLYLSSAINDQITFYRFEEDYGPSLEGQTIGFHYKESSDSYNFVGLENPTPNLRNSPPLVGPIVISEIMYHDDVEYLELLNVADSPQSLYDSGRNDSWRFDQGIQYQFPHGVSMDPGERIVLTSNINAFEEKYSPDRSLQLYQWTSGKLDNSGETVQLDRPGPLDDLGLRTYVRVDRVKYNDSAPWDSRADGSGLALVKSPVTEYGNDFRYWIADFPTPGEEAELSRYQEWANQNLVVDPTDDPDGDQRSNFMEYAFGTNPRVADSGNVVTVEGSQNVFTISYPVPDSGTAIRVILQRSDDLINWITLPTIVSNKRRFTTRIRVKEEYYRLHLTEED